MDEVPSVLKTNLRTLLIFSIHTVALEKQSMLCGANKDFNYW